MERDFLEVLDSDVAVKILKYLEDPADVVRACSVSQSWRDFGEQQFGFHFWDIN